MSIENDQMQIEYNELYLFNQKINKSELLFNSLVLKVINDDREWLYSCAKEICHEQQLYQNKFLSSMLDVQGVLELKLNNKKRGFTLEWYQNFHVMIKGNSTQISFALKFNDKTLKYSFLRQSWLESWDKQNAEYLEEKCMMLRRQQKKLIKMRDILTKIYN